MPAFSAHHLVRPLAEVALALAERPSARDAGAVLASLGPHLPTDDAAVPVALERLIRACFAEAELSALGRFALRWDVLRRLANLRRLGEAEAATRSLRETRIEAPLVITGMPRSGTTFLHTLLTADPRALAPRCFETLYPYPDPGRRDRRAARVARQLRRFSWLAPELRTMHLIDSAVPQECTEITAQVFESLRFEMLYAVPSYKAWLAARGHASAYRFHRRFLQHLQHQHGRPGRWVLKSPDHVFALDALRAVYPDARLVFLHRDPERALASVARLTEVLRAPFTRRVDRAAIGRQILADWGRGADIMVAETLRPSFPAGQVLHVRYRDLAARPAETARGIYRHFGLSWSPALEGALARRIAAMPNGGYGHNDYRLEDYGLSPDAVRARFAAYVQACVEPPAAAVAARPRARMHAGS